MSELTKYSLFIAIYALTFRIIYTNKFKQNTDKCEKRIFEECNHQSVFTEFEIERARVYIQAKMQQAELPPLRAPCERLRIRKDFKCMTEFERQRLIGALRQLYLNGGILELGDIHARHWKITHLSAQVIAFHRYLITKLEQKLMSIDPDLTLPYWVIIAIDCKQLFLSIDIHLQNNALDFSDPKKSLIFKYFGTNGSSTNGWCVEDGMFEGLDLKRCLRRQRTNNTIPQWESPELMTNFLQLSSHPPLVLTSFSSWHFLPHLAIGGYYGDMSVETAAYDILFYLFHIHTLDVLFAKIQLNHKPLISPVAEQAITLQNTTTGEYTYGQADFATATLMHYSNVTLVETFHLGYGEMCSITDQIIEDVNRVLNNTKQSIPTQIEMLSWSTKIVYFPRYALGDYTPFDYMWPDVGQCNPQCKPIPKFQTYFENPNGLRQMRRYDDDNQEVSLSTLPNMLTQAYFMQMYTDLHHDNYCSPFVL